MKTFNGVIRDLKTIYLQSRHSDSVTFNPERPIISISFDDVPLSAYENGIPLLNQYGMKATFYICLGLQGLLAKTHLSETELEDLTVQGHEVGCHTYTHYKLSKGNAKELSEDAEKNRAALSRATNNVNLSSFSYPFGELNFDAKRLLSKHYSSLRSTRHGVNRGRVDLRCLRAVPLYENNVNEGFFQHWINSAELNPGWLIFYTHGVSSNPGPYDIGVKSFERLLSYIRYRNINVIPVAEAVQAIRKK